MIGLIFSDDLLSDRHLKSNHIYNYFVFVDQDIPLQNEVIQVSKVFQWDLGDKKLVVRVDNHGLASQWFNAWVPD